MKSKVAILIAYTGTPFHGLQYQRTGIPTIEQTLVSSLVEHNLIKRMNSTDPKKMHLQRACRTDKGVHAAFNVVVVNLERGSYDEFIRRFDRLSMVDCRESSNEGVSSIDKRSNEGENDNGKSGNDKSGNEGVSSNDGIESCNEGENDNGKNNIDKSGNDKENQKHPNEVENVNQGEILYNDNNNDSSITPTTITNSTTNTASSTITDSTTNTASSSITIPTNNPFTNLTPTTTANLARYIHVYDIIKVPKSFNPKNRTDHRTYHYLLPQHLARLDSTALSSILALYTGTRNYHNFTQQSNTRGKSRHITSIRVERAHNGWYEIKITGQSFMMHQIRKMIGFVLLVINWGGEDGAVPAMERIRALFGCAFSERVLNIPKAPAHALFLDAPVFAGYNGRYENHRDLVVDEAEKAAVRERMIYKEIKTERCIRMFREWQECVEAHMYEYGYLKEVL